jgi:hypothetical protein
MKRGIELICKCGGTLIVIAIEEFPKDLPSHEKLAYNRVCDVECLSCGNKYYSQPYDSGKKVNLVKNTKKL